LRRWLSVSMTELHLHVVILDVQLVSG